jgi:hypothetical protein
MMLGLQGSGGRAEGLDYDGVEVDGQSTAGIASTTAGRGSSMSLVESGSP